MKTMLKFAIVATGLVLMLIAEVPLLHMRLVPEAHAIFGTRRRAFRWGVAAGESAGRQQQEQQQQQQQKQQQQQQAAPAAAPPPPPPPAAADKPLPLGTVVRTLPAGCTSTPVGGVDYFYCGGNFYRAAFQGNELVYVTAKP